MPDELSSRLPLVAAREAAVHAPSLPFLLLAPDAATELLSQKLAKYLTGVEQPAGAAVSPSSSALLPELLWTLRLCLSLTAQRAADASLIARLRKENRAMQRREEECVDAMLLHGLPLQCWQRKGATEDDVRDEEEDSEQEEEEKRQDEEAAVKGKADNSARRQGKRHCPAPAPAPPAATSLPELASSSPVVPALSMPSSTVAQQHIDRLISLLHSQQHDAIVQAQAAAASPSSSPACAPPPPAAVDAPLVEQLRHAVQSVREEAGGMQAEMELWLQQREAAAPSTQQRAEAQRLQSRRRALRLLHYQRLSRAQAQQIRSMHRELECWQQEAHSRLSDMAKTDSEQTVSVAQQQTHNDET